MPTSITEATNMTTYRAGSNAPASAVHRARPALPVPTFTAVAPASDVTWSDNGAGGTFAPSGANNATAIYTPRNQTQVVTITATDSGGSVNRTLGVFGTLPLNPQLGYEIELDVETKIKKARDGTEYSREDGVPEIAWALAWDNRENDARAEMFAFWFDHKRIYSFYVVDSESNLLNLVKFRSPLKSAPNGANRFAMGTTVRGTYQGIVAVGALPLHLKINCGALAVGSYQADQYFTNGFTFGDAAPVDSSGISDPAPDEVYQTSRYHDDYVQYLVTGLRPNHPYNIRMHFCNASTRTMVPTIQLVGLPSFDTLGGNVVTDELFEDKNADNLGNLLIRLDHTAGANTYISALEIIEQP